MSRKLSIESVSDAAGDDLLLALVHQTFCMPTAWGRLTNTAFALVIFGAGVLCWAESLVYFGAALFAASFFAIGARWYFLRHRCTQHDDAPFISRRRIGRIKRAELEV